MRVKELFTNDKPHFIATAALVVFAAALPFSVTLIQGGLFLFIAASLLARGKEGTLSLVPAQIKANPLFLPWLAYLAAGALAAAFGVSPARSAAILNSDLLTAVSFFGLCLFIKPEARDIALKAYLAAIAIAGVIGIYQALNGLAHGLDIRAHAFAHPVRFGEIMVISLALALSRLSAPEALTPRVKKFFYAAILFITSAIVLSQTRGAYLGTALVFAVLLAIRRPSKRVVMSLMAAVAALGLGLSMLNPALRYKLGSIFKGVNSAVSATAKAPDQSIDTRLTLWKIGVKMIKDRPLLGAGPANVKTLFPVYCEKPYPENTVWGSLHNLYIHQTAERGLVGLAALLTLFGAMFITALRNFRVAPFRFTLWALAIMPSWFLMNATEITFQHVHTSYAVLLALAVSVAAAKE
ncbi:MAG: O-antigen ligase family protein [Elusimicrobia bacterium]|nr:O-antigen ligase family protein [Elusimicrobiota bacterium]